MQTRGKALFNLIRMNWMEDPSLPVQEWQVEDYSTLELEELFERLEKLGISLDENRFKHFSGATTSPEELTETLWVAEGEEGYDEAYLLLFELWRRLLPERQSLSIFCDQLDRLIDQYDLGEIQNVEVLHEMLAELERVLDEHADQGDEPKEIFQEISLYCAHDLESFIYDFASDEIDYQHPLNASEIIDGFYPYIENEEWFEFLQLRLLANTDPQEADIMLDRVLEEQIENPDFELLLEIARFLVHRGDVTHFMTTINQCKHLIQTEQDFQELVALTSEFYRLLDKEEEAEKMGSLLKARQGRPLEQEISIKDPSVKSFIELFKDFDRSEA